MIAASVRITLAAVDDIDAIEAAWRALELEAAPSFFQSWTWVGCLAAERFPEPVLLRAERDGRTVGLALFNRVRSRLGIERLWLNESGDPTMDAVYTEHNGVLLALDAGDLLPACLDAMFTAPIASREYPARSWAWVRRLHFAGVDPAHLLAARRSGGVRRLRESAAPFVNLAALPAPPDAYLASLSANTRYQIRRSNRTFARLGPLEVREAQSLSEALAFLDALAKVHQHTWTLRGLPGAFSNPAFLRFHRALVARALPRREVALLRIASGPHLLGYLYNFRLGDRVFTYQSGIDYEGVAVLIGRHAKPGLTCHHAAILRARAHGAAVYDFLAGPDRYKTSLARDVRPLYWFEGAPSVSSLRMGFPSLRSGQSRRS